MEKVELPIKTKIAAWWMILIGGISSILMLFSTIQWIFFPRGAPGQIWGMTRSDFIMGLIGMGFYFCFFLTPFLGGFYILKRKKLVWRITIIALIIELLILIFFWYQFGWQQVFLLFATIFVTLSLILLLLDRKNFWKIAT